MPTDLECSCESKRRSLSSGLAASQPLKYLPTLVTLILSVLNLDLHNFKLEQET